MAPELARLFGLLAEAFDAEDRAGGAAAARALRRARPQTLRAVDGVATGLPAAALRRARSPLARAARAALGAIAWTPSGRDGRIPRALSERMFTAELVGPDGAFHDDRVRVGLFVQPAGLVYGLRAHAAEETFLTLAGRALWSRGEAARWIGPGRTVHHPAGVPHGTVTTRWPMLAAWRWSGEIGWSGYRMLSEPGDGPPARGAQRAQ